jgi:hypothetical protein
MPFGRIQRGSERDLPICFRLHSLLRILAVDADPWLSSKRWREIRQQISKPLGASVDNTSEVMPAPFSAHDEPPGCRNGKPLGHSRQNDMSGERYWPWRLMSCRPESRTDSAMTTKNTSSGAF